MSAVAGRWYLDASIVQGGAGVFEHANFDGVDYELGAERVAIVHPMFGPTPMYRVSREGLYLVSASFTLAMMAPGVAPVASFRMNVYDESRAVMTTPLRRLAYALQMQPTVMASFHFVAQVPLARFESVGFDFTTDGSAVLVGRTGTGGTDDTTWLELARIADMRVVRE